MKTFLNLKQYLILFAAIFSLTSCLKSDDPDFQVAGAGYVVQVNSNSTSSFFPMVQIYANDYMTGGCSVTNGNVNIDLVDMGNTNKQYLKTNVSMQSMLANSDLTKVTGQYTITAQNGSGEQATSWLSLSASKPMGILKGDIAIDDDGTITAYFNIVDEADYYYIFLQKEDYDFNKYGSKYWSEAELKKGELVIEGEYKDCYKVTTSINSLVGTSTELATGKYILVTAAASTNSNYGDFVILQQGAKKDYTK